MLAQPLMHSLRLLGEFRSMMPDGLKELLRAFNDQGVKYLIVGGYAFGVHAEPRATKELDIFIRSDEQNAAAVFRALAQYGAPLGDLKPADFMDGTTFQIGQPPARIDILQQIDGVSFDEAWEKTGSRESSTAKSKRQSYPRTTSSEISLQPDASKTF
jgi:hypothetical protein